MYRSIKLDKKKHLVAGIVISLTAVIIFNPIFIHINGFGFIIATIIGILKEVVWDKILGKGQYENLDIIYTMVGGIVPEILYFTISIITTYYIL